MYAQRPLRADELAEAIAVEPLDPSWDSEKIPTDLDHMIASCGSLVVLENQDNTVRLAHHTVQQFLIVPGDEQLTYSIQTRDDEARDYVSAICITYLSFSDFESQMIRIDPPNTLERSGILTAAGVSQIPSILGISSTIIDLANRMFPRSPTQEPLHLEYKTLSNTLKKNPPSAQISEKYRLLNYIIKYWNWHTRHSKTLNARNENLIWQAFKHLALHKTTTFEFREWEERQSLSYLRYYSMFVWAIETGHTPLLRLIEQMLHEKQQTQSSGLLYPTFNYYYTKMMSLQQAELIKETSGEPKLWTLETCNRFSIFKACNHNHHDVISFLRSRGIDLSSPDLLLFAIEGDSLETFEILYDQRTHIQLERGQTVLQFAAQGGRNRIVKFLLQTDIPLDTENKACQTALHLAANNGHSEVVMSLLQKGANGRLKDCDGNTLLTIATEKENRDSVRAILKQYMTDEDGTFRNAVKDNYFGDEQLNDGAALLIAARASCTDIAIDIIEAGSQVPGRDPWPSFLGPFDINAKTTLGETALHFAIFRRNYLLAKCLLDNGADTDLQDNSGATTFMYAVRYADEKMVYMLEEHGANTIAQDRSGATALSTAVLLRKKDMVEHLLNRGQATAINIGNKGASTPLHIISSTSHLDSSDSPLILKILLKYGADIEARNTYSRTPLLAAAMTWHDGAVEELLKHSPNIEARDSRGLTPLLATLIGDSPWQGIPRFVESRERALPLLHITRMLLSHDADVNATTTAGENAMVLAVKYRTPVQLKLELFRKGASVYLKDNTNQNALDYAVQEKDFETLQILQPHGLYTRRPELLAESSDFEEEERFQSSFS